LISRSLIARQENDAKTTLASPLPGPQISGFGKSGDVHFERPRVFPRSRKIILAAFKLTVLGTTSTLTAPTRSPD
jgi:hypothetical protein